MKGPRHYLWMSCIIVTGMIFSISYGFYINHVNAQRTQALRIKRTLPKRHTLQQLSVISRRHPGSRDSQYRIYSHHYLTIEHRDLVFLRDLGNQLGHISNHVANDDYSISDVYHKYHDGNYWNIFHDNCTPGNFKGSHMSNKTYHFIDKRVLKSHGVYSGVNFGSKIPVYSINY